MNHPLFHLHSAIAQWCKLLNTRSFRIADALTQWHILLMPARLRVGFLLRLLDKRTTIARQKDGDYMISVSGMDLQFLWPSRPGADIGHLVDTIVNERNPHHYLSSPIQLSKKTTVVDIGACEGAFGLYCASTAACRVVAIEPSEEFCGLIRRSSQIMNVEDLIRVECMACGSSNGYCTVEEAEEGTTILPIASSRGVPVATLDSLVEKGTICVGTRDLIKIDAEGCEMSILRGAEETIRQFHPQLAIALYHKQSDAQEVYAYLKVIYPNYKIRIRGFSWWTQTPTPVMLLASAV